MYHPPGVVRVVFHPVPFSKLLDCAFEQIIHYGKTDAAVTLRVMRALGDIASATRERAHLEAVRACAGRVAKACAGHLPEGSVDDFARRLDRVERLSAVDD
jgi:uncharacterized membrane protein